eukprot:SAG31_NODE_29382_length_396_cov_0.804714_1_plen_81_part_01
MQVTLVLGKTQTARRRIRGFCGVLSLFYSCLLLLAAWAPAVRAPLLALYHVDPASQTAQLVSTMLALMVFVPQLEVCRRYH